MTEPEQPASLADDELVYRRIPVSMGWCDGKTISPEAFAPRKDEVSGISVIRANLRSAEAAAQGKSKQGYWIAVLRVGDLRAHGMEVVAKPDTPAGFDLAHAEIPELNNQSHGTDLALQRTVLLARKLCTEILGPFVPTQAEGPP